jgi:hypothetical protein
MSSGATVRPRAAGLLFGCAHEAFFKCGAVQALSVRRQDILAHVLMRGRDVRVPAETVLRFRLDRVVMLPEG